MTSLDMDVRDRPSSDVPAQKAERATDLVDIRLATDGSEVSEPHGQNRKHGLVP